MAHIYWPKKLVSVEKGRKAQEKRRRQHRFPFLFLRLGLSLCVSSLSLSFGQKKKKEEEELGVWATMVGTNLKAETMGLMEKRTAIEAEMNLIIDRLCQPGGPGLSGNLLDSEGFPRSDVDIPVVRAERLRLSELRNDHKEITEKINRNIEVMHSARLAPRTSSPKEPGLDVRSDNRTSVTLSDVASASSNNVPSGSSNVMDVDMIASIPFAMVDEIADASPAAEDGLQLGDQIVKFGNVEAGDNLLQRLASEAQSNEGSAILVVLMRHGAIINVTVTPRTWQGRGLLGNRDIRHFLPLPPQLGIYKRIFSLYLELVITAVIAY
ncbi:PDZ domain containing protein [Parasponia andersonii]|uniref:PDZ domain containing protein n=1 Tax=Parasponia andersonii TaxID=3476 RepID=A0A2P5AZC9_PARAD|nr:PDZ domain containing protein [Parasponia andersonii]